MNDMLISEGFILLTEGRRIKNSLIGHKRVIQMYTIGGLFFDLLVRDIIYFDEKNNIILKKGTVELEDESLKELYVLIRDQKPKTFKKWIKYFNISSTDRKYLYQLLLSNIEFNHKDELKENIVQEIRAELLEFGEVTEEIIALSLLLDSSKLIDQYFSAHEINQLKSRIKDFKDQYGQRWKSIKQIRKQLENMDAIILAYTIRI